jgi:hypothetical protein
VTSVITLFRFTEAGAWIDILPVAGVYTISQWLGYFKIEAQITRSRLAVSAIVFVGVMVGLGYYWGVSWVGAAVWVLWSVCAWGLTIGLEDAKGKTD